MDHDVAAGGLDEWMLRSRGGATLTGHPKVGAGPLCPMFTTKRLGFSDCKIRASLNIVHRVWALPAR